MMAGKPEMSEGSAVGAQLVGRHPRRREALFAEQLAHQLDGRRPVATTERWIAFSHDLLRRLGSEWEPPKRLPIAQQRKLRLRQLRREASFRTTTRTGHGPHGTAD